MLSRLAQNAAYFFAEKDVIKKEDIKIYAYGYEILFSEAINWIITIIISIATKSVLKTIVYMISFMQLRESIGGFHAKTHLGCIIISTVVYVLCLFLWSYTPYEWHRVIIVSGLILHLILVLAIAPVEHPNKPFSEKEAVRFRKKGCILSLIYIDISLLLMMLPWNICSVYSYAVLLGLLSASVSMEIEYLRQTEEPAELAKFKKA